MIISLFLVFLASILTGISQVLLKIGSSHQGTQKNSIFAAYFNLATITAYIIFLIVTLIIVIALKEIPLKLAYAIASLSFVVTALLSWVILKEKISKNMIFAILLIIFGIIIFNIN